MHKCDSVRFSNPTASPKLSFLLKLGHVLTITELTGYLRHQQAVREKHIIKPSQQELLWEAIPLFQDHGRYRRHHREMLLSAWPSSRVTTQTVFLCLSEPFTQLPGGNSPPAQACGFGPGSSLLHRAGPLGWTYTDKPVRRLARASQALAADGCAFRQPLLSSQKEKTRP